ncbi:hypothetical protein P8452_60346 [Trifolium repens]|nr:hypothetical protein P8452_60346 [Trifolium repens]
MQESIMTLNGISTVVSLLSHYKTVIHREVATTLAGLCYWRLPPIGQREPVLGALENLVMSYNDKTVYHACWAIAYIARVDIQLVISGNFIVLFKRLLVNWLDTFEIENTPEIEAILRTYVSVSAGHNTDIDVLIQEGILPCLHRMINLEGRRVRDKGIQKNVPTIRL